MTARLRWAVVAVAAAGILGASVLGGPVDPPLLDPAEGVADPPDAAGPLDAVGTDKWVHAVSYAVLAGTIAAALASRRADPRAIALVFGGAVLFGAAVEGLQATLYWRTGSVYDALANAVGAGVVVVAWRIVVVVDDRRRRSAVDTAD